MSGPSESPSCKALKVIAHLAPSLRERELRVLITLSTLFADKQDRKGNVSAREMEKLSGLSRSNIQLAIQELAAAQTIQITPGTATQPIGFDLTFMDLEVIGGPIPGPPPEENSPQVALFQGHPGPIPGPPPEENSPQVALFQGHPGPIPGPPPEENSPQVALFQGHPGPIPGPPPNKEHAAARASIDFDLKPDRSIDGSRRSVQDSEHAQADSLIHRLLSANPKYTPSADLEHARRHVYGYQRKFGRNEHPQVPYEPHPPDDKILAQLCAILSPIAIENLLCELTAERKQPGYQYSWYVTVALQRRYGIAPEVLRSMRQSLRVEPYRGKALSGEQQPLLEKHEPGDPQFSQDLVADVQRRRKAKA
jgi:hypothetical protein